MLTNKLLIYGAGETAEIIADYFKMDSEFEVIGFCVDKEFIKTDIINDLPVFPFEDIVETHPPNEYWMFVAASFNKLNRIRQNMYEKAKLLGYKLATYVSSNAFIWHNSKIGENTFIFENNVIQYKVVIGNNCILWSGNHVGHQTIIKDNCFVSSHVVISGYCNIGENTFIGVNSSINDEISIGNDCILGNSTVVTKNLDNDGIYVGSPAKRLKSAKASFNIES